MPNWPRILTVCFTYISCCLFSNLSQAQVQVESVQTDSTFEIVDPIQTTHSAKKAALLSLALPGAGQVYNKKAWKVPIVYALLGGAGSWLYYNQREYNGYREAYRIQVDGDDSTTASYRGFTAPNQLRLQRDQFKQSRDLAIALVVVAYALNVIDAAVDAHLFHFDVSDDLSLDVEPRFEFAPYDVRASNYQLALKLSF